MFPPAASIASFAEAENLCALTVSFDSSLPSPKTLTPSFSLRMTRFEAAIPE
ncbi:hypothetical protein NBRC111894_3458 [Sporolactobacillus inulinus]|uniref:Uncharacterized protein n=1 Tax=Sporolactobacillus inulinus TaxID=2078 RepID=A0A4Y1ZG44_9BACL|nr:hypothetical protein NBRC111894_3458 [Sporolactobacillus inulinus]